MPSIANKICYVIFNRKTQNVAWEYLPPIMKRRMHQGSVDKTYSLYIRCNLLAVRDLYGQVSYTT